MRLVILIFALSFSSSLLALNKFSVLSYNVENFFDTQKDSGKNDWTFLPGDFPGKKAECDKIGYWRYKEACHKIDWTEKKVALKLNQIKKYVESLANKPSFIGLSEIENEAVVSKIAVTLGYNKFVVSQSPDRRGIDVALLFNESADIKLVSKKEHTLKDKYFLKKPTRNILEASFLINNKDKLTLFVNHWPSLGNPTSTRIVAASTLKSRMQSLNKKGHYLIALGDFNTIAENNPRPFEDVLLKGTGFSDIHDLFMKDRNIAKEVKREMPLGTYFYAPKMSWNRLDRIIINKRLNDGKKLDLVKKSYSIHNPSFSTSEHRYTKGALKGSIVKGIPAAYDHEANNKRKAGFSDHFGIVADFIYR
jgi:hypothetical protein